MLIQKKVTGIRNKATFMCYKVDSKCFFVLTYVIHICNFFSVRRYIDVLFLVSRILQPESNYRKILGYNLVFLNIN